MEWNKIQQKALLALLIGHGLFRWIHLGMHAEKRSEPASLDALESLAWMNDLPEPKNFKPRFQYQKRKNYPSQNRENCPNQAFWGDTVQENTWVVWGCSPKQAATIHRLAQQRKRPWDAEDVKACKYIPAPLREKLPPLWMVRTETKESKIPIMGKEKAKVDINQADSLELLDVPGIGPFLAGKILEVRRQVGGFHALQQVRWLSGMRQGTCDSICEFLTLTPAPLKTVSFAFAGREDYFKIPGFRKKTVYQIINYRNRHGPFQSPEDWVKLGFMSDTLLKDILPYLKLP